MNALFPPHLLQFPHQVAQEQVLCFREKVYVFLMEHPHASHAAWAVFQTSLLYLGGLGGWSDHIRLSLSEYFDTVEATRRLCAKTLPGSHTAAQGSPRPSDSAAAPKSVMRCHSQRLGSASRGRTGVKVAISEPDHNSPHRNIQEHMSAASRGAKQPAARESPPPGAVGGLVAHPALRGGVFAMEQLAGQGLALPEDCGPLHLAPGFSGREDGDESSAVGFTEPPPGPTPAGYAATGVIEHSLQASDQYWPPHLEDHPAFVTPAMIVVQAVPLSPSRGVADPSPLVHLQGSQQRNNVSRLLQRWRSAESMVSKFQSRGQNKPLQVGAESPVPTDNDLTVPRPATTQGTRATSKSIRFNDEESAQVREAAKRSVTHLFPPRRERADDWLYTRAHQMEKAAADRERRPCRLPPPTQQWRWEVAEERSFSIRAVAPRSAMSSEWDTSELHHTRREEPPTGSAMEDSIEDSTQTGEAGHSDS